MPIGKSLTKFLIILIRTIKMMSDMSEGNESERRDHGQRHLSQERMN